MPGSAAASASQWASQWASGRLRVLLPSPPQPYTPVSSGASHWMTVTNSLLSEDQWSMVFDHSVLGLGTSTDLSDRCRIHLGPKCTYVEEHRQCIPRSRGSADVWKWTYTWNFKFCCSTGSYQLSLIKQSKNVLLSYNSQLEAAEQSHTCKCLGTLCSSSLLPVRA